MEIYYDHVQLIRWGLTFIPKQLFNGVFVPGLTTPMGLDIVGLNMFEQMPLGWGLSLTITCTGKLGSYSS